MRFDYFYAFQKLFSGISCNGYGVKLLKDFLLCHFPMLKPTDKDGTFYDAENEMGYRVSSVLHEVTIEPYSDIGTLKHSGNVATMHITESNASVISYIDGTIVIESFFYGLYNLTSDLTVTTRYFDSDAVKEAIANGNKTLDSFLNTRHLIPDATIEVTLKTKYHPSKPCVIQKLEGETNIRGGLSKKTILTIEDDELEAWEYKYKAYALARGFTNPILEQLRSSDAQKYAERDKRKTFQNVHMANYLKD